MANPKISVFTTLYNHERYIEFALRSALRQTLPPAEIVVVDDASSDDSVRVARSIDHPLIRVLVQKQNLGGANTVKPLALCKGQFVAILNSDDAWEAAKLDKQSRVMLSRQNVGVVFTHIKAIDEYGVQWANGSHQLQQKFGARNRTRHEWLRYFFLNGNPFCASSALVRKECLDDVGPFNGSHVQLQDFDMWVRLAIGGYDIHIIEEPLTYYRVMKKGTNMSTADAGARASNTLEYAMTLRHFWRLPSLNDLICVFPEIQVHDKANDSLTLFYLARHAALLPGVHHRLFALETMFKWGGNQDAMGLAQDCHGFGFADYRNFISNGPIRQMLKCSIRYQINRFAMSVMPYSMYQRIKTRLGTMMQSMQ